MCVVWMRRGWWIGQCAGAMAWVAGWTCVWAGGVAGWLRGVGEVRGRGGVCRCGWGAWRERERGRRGGHG